MLIELSLVEPRNQRGEDPRDNIRFLQWICGRLTGSAEGVASPVGTLPVGLDLAGLELLHHDAVAVDHALVAARRDAGVGVVLAGKP